VRQYIGKHRIQQGPRPARVDRDRPAWGPPPVGRVASGQPAGGRGRRRWLRRRRPRPGGGRV